MLKESQAVDVPPLKISKTIKLPVLIDHFEMEELLKALSEPSFYLVQGLSEREEGILSSADFLTIYSDYIQQLKNDKLLQNDFRNPFSSAMSLSHEALRSIPVDGGKQVIRAILPIVQLQPNLITYSKEESVFRTQLYGEGGISWGVQFSYPLLYQDPVTQDILDVDLNFPNTLLFKNLQKWLRHATSPTPFIVGGERINAPIRLGKRCFSWIQSHPDLVRKGIRIHGAS